MGPRRVRAVLRQMGLLYSEGYHGRLRLTPEAVAKGLGKRIEQSKRVKHPFDVLSPAGQALIAERWEAAVTDLDGAKTSHPLLTEAKAALERLQASRTGLTAQMLVCWARDSFPDLSLSEVAVLLDMTLPHVSRYASKQDKQRAFLRQQRAQELPLLGGQRRESLAAKEAADAWLSALGHALPEPPSDPQPTRNQDHRCT